MSNAAYSELRDAGQLMVVPWHTNCIIQGIQIAQYNGSLRDVPQMHHLYLQRFTLSATFSSQAASSKLVIGAGTLSPFTATCVRVWMLM